MSITTEQRGSRARFFSVIARSGVIPPVAIRSTPDGFVLPLPFGERVDWCRNLLAGGGGVIHWRGVHFAVVQPEIIDGATAARSFNPYMRVVLRAFRVKSAIRLRRASDRPTT